MSSLASGTAIHHNKEVRLDLPPSQDSESTAVPEPSEKPHSKKPKFSWNPQKWKYPAILSWVPGQLNWQGLRPVIRSSVASWIVCPPAKKSWLMGSRFCCCFVPRRKRSREQLRSCTLL